MLALWPVVRPGEGCPGASRDRSASYKPQWTLLPSAPSALALAPSLLLPHMLTSFPRTAPHLSTPVSPSPADCMGVAGCTPFFPSARKKCVVSTCLLPALGLTALGGLQGFYPSRILGLHTRASWKSDALVYTSGGGDRSVPTQPCDMCLTSD